MYIYCITIAHAGVHVHVYHSTARDLETSSQSLKALLLKHARMSTGPKGEKVFNAKRAVT